MYTGETIWVSTVLTPQGFSWPTCSSSLLDIWSLNSHEDNIQGITIRLPTDATLYFMYLFPFLLIFTLHVSGSHKPIISGISSCFLIYNHLVPVLNKR
jgi:hypothetical protein